MGILAAVGFGSAGGLAVELAELAKFVSLHGHVPWSSGKKLKLANGAQAVYAGRGTYLLAVLIRVVLGAILSGVVATTSLTALAAFMTGAGSYAIIGRMADTASLPTGETATTSLPAKDSERSS